MNEKIRHYREKAGLTQRQLAEALGLNQSSVALWESGRAEPTIHNLRRLADILNCRPADLL